MSSSSSFSFVAEPLIGTRRRSRDASTYRRTRGEVTHFGRYTKPSHECLHAYTQINIRIRHIVYIQCIDDSAHVRAVTTVLPRNNDVSAMRFHSNVLAVADGVIKHWGML